MKATRIRVIPYLLCGLGVLFNSHHSQANVEQSIFEKEAVKQSIITMVNAIDSKQWGIAASQFTQNVYVDYSSLSGQAGASTKSQDLVDGWASLLHSVNSHHMLSNFDITIDKDNAKAYSYSHIYASHEAKDIGYWDVYGRYYHELSKVNNQWRINTMKLIVHGQRGNLNFLQELSKMNQDISSNVSNKVSKNASKDMYKKKVQYTSEGEQVVGEMYLPAHFDPKKQYTAVIVSGSWTTVKEQMAGLYAKKLAAQGFIALAFDPRNFGESEGKARFYENPTQKIVDIKSAVTYLKNQPYINEGKIAALGICAGSMYTLMAAAEDNRIKSVVTTASWLHDAEAVKLFYGGEEGVQGKIAAAQRAKQHFTKTGEIEYIPTISTTDESAAMYGPYDYYLNPERGAVPEWSSDKFAIMSWEDWLKVDPMPSAKKLNTPTLMIHSDGAVLPQYTKQYFNNIATMDKELYWMETDVESPYHQFSFYDQTHEVEESIKQATRWLRKTL